MLKNKCIWLIGASEGIGRALASQLAAQGAKLIISSRNQERLQSLLSDIGSDIHHAVACDVTQIGSVENAWKEIAPRGIDMVIYNAGNYEPMSADKMDLNNALQMINTNLTGVFHILHKVIPAFVTAKRGQIVLVGSVAGYRGLPRSIGYGASKAGLINLAETLRCDLFQHNIHVQIVNPGFVATRLTEKNSFAMPGIISPEKAARYMVEGIQKNTFEIRFPWAFTTLLKVMRLLPDRWYFSIANRLG